MLNRKVYILLDTSIDMENIIQKVWSNKYNGQKLITIPKNSNVEIGDWVQVLKLEDDQKEVQ